MDKYLNKNGIAHKVENGEIFLDVKSLVQWLVEDKKSSKGHDVDEDFAAFFISMAPSHEFIPLTEIRKIMDKLIRSSINYPSRLSGISIVVSYEFMLRSRK